MTGKQFLKQIALKRSRKYAVRTKKSFSGTGLMEMLDVAYENGLTEENSVVKVKDPTDLGSKWTIKRKN